MSQKSAERRTSEGNIAACEGKFGERTTHNGTAESEAMNTTEEESEALHRQLLDGEIEVGVFLQKYKKLRTTYHRRALTHLAAKTSLTG
ncbi:hypothetical protein RHMOL_Rhmol03G0094500 [Rhododendron molle]|uniref:Uncharacterized protein n=1 Tax=Rhododendron molle TaxID=49168 RepID=A0ACC0PDF2_RHOML|nr:hypothetical protein RHMOL_Rhmol03G0094500 [Rhododendron molle]